MEFEPDIGEGRSRATSHLTILSHETTPDELAQLVGFEPDEAWSKGDQRGILRRAQPFNGVIYESGIDELEAPSAHLRALLTRLAAHSDEIAAVAAMPVTHSVRVYIVEPPVTVTGQSPAQRQRQLLDRRRPPGVSCDRCDES